MVSLTVDEQTQRRPSREREREGDRGRQQQTNRERHGDGQRHSSEETDGLGMTPVGLPGIVSLAFMRKPANLVHFCSACMRSEMSTGGFCSAWFLLWLYATHRVSFCKTTVLL